MMRRTLILSFISLMLFIPTMLLGQTYDEMFVKMQALQIRVLVLQRENDSLKRALAYREAVKEDKISSLEVGGVFDTWSLLKSGDNVIGEDAVTPDPRFLVENGQKSVYQIRLEELGGVLSIPYDSRLGGYIESYSVARRDKMSQVLKRYDRWAKLFTDTFKKRGVPEEITLLSVVESAVNSRAVSFMGAAGMWQLMPDTAVEWGLEVGLKNDERFDVEKSTDVAARYLKALYDFFGDWALAVCAYNCGPGNVSNAIRKAGNRRGFWDIYDFLPVETRGYLPSLIATMYFQKYN